MHGFILIIYILLTLMSNVAFYFCMLNWYYTPRFKTLTWQIEPLNFHLFHQTLSRSPSKARSLLGARPWSLIFVFICHCWLARRYWMGQGVWKLRRLERLRSEASHAIIARLWKRNSFRRSLFVLGNSEFRILFFQQKMAEDWSWMQRQKFAQSLYFFEFSCERP